jgi:hypothetical protein
MPISNPIRPHPAWRNTALSLPFPSSPSPIPVMSYAPQPPSGFFPGVVLLPMVRHQACIHNQNPVPELGDSGEEALPIVLRILLGSTPDILSQGVSLACKLAPIGAEPPFPPILTRLDSQVFSAPAFQLARLRQSRVAPNNQRNGAYTPCTAQLEIVRKTLYLPCRTSSLPLLQAL